MCLDIHMRIESLHRIAGALNLWFANIVGREDHLALQIRQRHIVIVDDTKRADSGGGKVKQNRRAEAAGADDQHARGLEFGLARSSHFAQHNVAGIAFEFFGIEHQG
jgi:hypothetical protein